MTRFEYSVTTKASPALAWLVFSDLHRWNTFANVYGQLRWRDGNPWEPGSLLQIEILRPVNAVIDHVITTCVPGKKVGWIDHAIGVAMPNGSHLKIALWRGPVSTPGAKSFTRASPSAGARWRS